jgi:hypothetical protein
MVGFSLLMFIYFDASILINVLQFRQNEYLTLNSKTLIRTKNQQLKSDRYIKVFVK